MVLSTSYRTHPSSDPPKEATTMTLFYRFFLMSFRDLKTYGLQMAGLDCVSMTSKDILLIISCSSVGSNLPSAVSLMCRRPLLSSRLLSPKMITQKLY